MRRLTALRIHGDIATRCNIRILELGDRRGLQHGAGCSAGGASTRTRCCANHQGVGADGAAGFYLDILLRTAQCGGAEEIKVILAVGSLTTASARLCRSLHRQPGPCPAAEVVLVDGSPTNAGLGEGGNHVHTGHHRNALADNRRKRHRHARAKRVDRLAGCRVHRQATATIPSQ